MRTGYTIKALAERSGFTPTALRYYEDIGLLPEAPRTPAGYRVYDDSMLERLRSSRAPSSSAAPSRRSPTWRPLGKVVPVARSRTACGAWWLTSSPARRPRSPS